MTSVAPERTSEQVGAELEALDAWEAQHSTPARKAERTRYLRNLRRTDGGDPGPFGEFLARAIIDTLMRFLVPAVAGPARLVPLAALARRGVSVRSLRAAAERGRLRAQRDARGQWRSTRRWVDNYRASRYKRQG